MCGIQTDRREPVVKRGVWYIPSFSSRRKLYHVRMSGIFGRWVCDCPDWQNRRRLEGTNCKHIRIVKEIIDTWSMEELEGVEFK